MDSYTCLTFLVCTSILILFIIDYLSPRLRSSFPPTPVWRGVLWYRWRSLPSPEAISFSPFTGVIFPHKIRIRAKSAWLCFILHLVFVNSMIVWSQFGNREEKQNCPNPIPPNRCEWSAQLGTTNYVSILGTFFFILLRIFQTHAWYDGLALDIPEASSMTTVIVALSLSCLMQQSERGLILGFSPNSDTLTLLTNVARRCHGYVYAFTVVFTFWYHPTEGGMMHLPGFFMIILFLFQGCLMFTASHLNVVWRTFLEMLILPHTLLVEKARSHRNLWKMFVSGYTILFLMSHMHAFHISFLAKSVLSLTAVFVLYSMYSSSVRTLVTESLRIPVTYYAFILIFYVSLYVPYSALSLLGYWPEEQVSGTMTRDPHPSLIICVISLLVATVVLVGLVGEFFERKLRSLALQAGSPSDKIQSLFEDPSERIPVRTGVLPKISWEELEQHKHVYDCWVAIHGVVYDVTEFVRFHPGGSAILLRYGGQDGSAGFDCVRENQGHPRLIRERMKSLACAVIAK